MNKKLQVFISSTYTDLIEERQAAVQAVLSAGHIPAGMELFTAGDQSQKEIIKEWIEESDVYMLILGGRYGSIDKETGKSYTHWEYDYACEINKPRFSLVLTDDAINHKIEVIKDHKKVLEYDNAQLYKEFKDNLISSKLVNMIDDLKDIENGILKSLRKIERSSNLSGWISGKDVPDVKSLLEENSKLLKENLKLTSVIKKLNEKLELENRYNGHSYEYVKKYLNQTMIDVTSFSFYKGEDVQKSAVYLLKWLGDVLISGFKIQNLDRDRGVIYYKLCPILMRFELIERVKGTNKQSDRLQLSKTGKQFLVQLESENNNENNDNNELYVTSKPKSKSIASSV